MGGGISEFVDWLNLDFEWRGGWEVLGFLFVWSVGDVRIVIDGFGGGRVVLSRICWVLGICGTCV